MPANIEVSRIGGSGAARTSGGYFKVNNKGNRVMYDRHNWFGNQTTISLVNG